MAYLVNLIYIFKCSLDQLITILYKRKDSLIEVQSGDSGGISATGKTPQEPGFGDEEAYRAPHRTRPLGTEINLPYNSP